MVSWLTQDFYDLFRAPQGIFRYALVDAKVGWPVDFQRNSHDDFVDAIVVNQSFISSAKNVFFVAEIVVTSHPVVH